MTAALLLLASATFGANATPTRAEDRSLPLADLILTGGRVYLGRGRFAEAIAVRANRIAALGSDAEILALKGPKTQHGLLKGRLVLPGFHDAGLFFFEGSQTIAHADLRGAASLEDIQARVRARLESHPEEDWLIARGWEPSIFPEGRWPEKTDIDAVVSTRAAALWSADGRMLWLSSEGLRRAGIWSQTEEISGGRIVRGAGNIPTGLLIGNAVELARAVLPRQDDARRRRALQDAAALAARAGVTSLHALPAAGDPPLARSYEDWKILRSSAAFPQRLFVYGRLEEPGEAEALRRQAAATPRARFAVLGLYAVLDGDFLDRAAALLEPYFDDPDKRGNLKYATGRLQALVRRAHQKHLRAVLRAAGDRAARQALDACEKSARRAKEEDLILPLRPCRVDAELIAADDMPRLKALGAAGASPAVFTFPDASANFYPNRVGDRARLVLPLKDLARAGAPIALWTGWPQRALSPLKALHAAVLRRFEDGLPAQGWFPAQRLSIEEGLEALTAEPARQAGLGDQLGTLARGRLADLVVLDRDIFADPQTLGEARVDLTVIDGKVVYRRE